MIRRYSQKCSICSTRVTVDAGGPAWATKKFKRQGWFFLYPVMWYCPECNAKRKAAKAASIEAK